MEDKFLRCECESPNHLLRVSVIEDEDKEKRVAFFFNCLIFKNDFPKWFDRLKMSIAFLFGKPLKCEDEWIATNDGIKELVKFLNEYDSKI